VTGKAMKGAMNAVMTNGVLRLAAKPQPNLSPAALLGELNDVLKERLEELMNVTMVIGLVSVEAKRLTLANAAHHAHPLLVRKGEVQRLIAKGMLLGMMAGIRYREVEFLLQSGDVVAFMTDGIIEITDSSGQDYAGSGQLEQVIGGFTAEMPPREMVDVLIDDALAYGRRKAEQDDYMTVVVLRLK